MLLRTMDAQLEVLVNRARKVNDKMMEVKQDLATAKQAKNEVQERILCDLLLSLSNRLLGLQEEKLLLLRQAPSKPCLQLVHTGAHHVAFHSVCKNSRHISMCLEHTLVHTFASIDNPLMQP